MGCIKKAEKWYGISKPMSDTPEEAIIERNSSGREWGKAKKISPYSRAKNLYPKYKEANIKCNYNHARRTSQII